MRLPKGYKVLPPVHPNAGIEAEYRRKLERLVDEMARSYAHWIKAQYRETPPVLAQDAVPARELQRELSLLGKRWQLRIDSVAPKLAGWFAHASAGTSNRGLKKILADGGMTVEFKMTAAMRDAYQATLQENVGLIRSIATEYHSQVEGLVMRSVSAGRDLKGLTDELEHRFGVTRRRAKLIALNQNNQATAAFIRVKQTDLGLKAIWLHSHGGREPRPTHLANSGNAYDPKVGWFDPDPKVRKHIWPGQIINCRCVSRSIVKGFS